MKKTMKVSTVALAVGAAIAASSAWAQEEVTEDTKRGIEVIEVTATKRVSSEQETPIAISAFTPDTLEKNQVKTVRDLVSLVPTLNIATHGDSNALDVTMRGVGSTNRTELGDPAVAFHVNDVYSPRPQGAAVLMYDLERVEVLRGPQGTLFGRNATVGAINLYTKKPRIGEFEGDSSIGFGNYGSQMFKGAVNLPVSDSFALRFAGYHQQHEGYVDNISSYDDYYLKEGSAIGGGARFDAPATGFAVSKDGNQKGYDSADQTSFRLSALYDGGDRLTWLTTAEWYEDQGTGYIQIDPYIVEKHDDRVAVVDSPGSVDMTNLGISSRIDYAITDGIDVSYVLGYNKQKRSQVTDTDLGVSATTFQENRTEWSDYEFWSHEIQARSNNDGPFNWIVGAYTSKEENAIRFDIDLYNVGGGNWIGGGDEAGGAIFIQPDRQLETKAVFAQVDYELTEELKLTAGARYMEDEKTDKGGRSLNCDMNLRGPFAWSSLQGDFGTPYEDANIQAGAVNNGSNAGMPADTHCWVRQVNDNPNPNYNPDLDDPNNERNNEWDKTTWLVRADWKATEDIMTYASVSTGFKSGILQDTGGTAAPEELTNYEIGLKSFWLDGLLKANIAAYKMDYEDLQVSAPQLIDTDGDGELDSNKGSLGTTNAAEATIEGLEIELEWLVFENGRFNLSGAFLSAEYDEYYNAGNTAAQVYNKPGPAGTLDLSGNKLVRAPDYDFTLAYEHEFDLGHGYLVPRIKVQISDEYFLDEFNLDTAYVDGAGNYTATKTENVVKNLRSQESFQLWDASVRYESGKYPYTIEAYVNNFTDEAVKTADGGISDTPYGSFAYYNPPRTFGVNVHYRFE
ncbi:TonB-dependent receptor [Echinimonas agarilytica]|uniref:TonB-dependent receptor n=1 Tax=Echinimonas agarilytica TaxID=1215918 RepID=A0AA41W7T2_9GAMM|nr:TonB-dependent receptor [Echinimonas agarilytica]MCM2680495.1 TonB-dependent receptor [Echinimonas agarilytica]